MYWTVSGSEHKLNYVSGASSAVVCEIVRFLDLLKVFFSVYAQQMTSGSFPMSCYLIPSKYGYNKIHICCLSTALGTTGVLTVTHTQTKNP